MSSVSKKTFDWDVRSTSWSRVLERRASEGPSRAQTRANDDADTFQNKLRGQRDEITGVVNEPSDNVDAVWV